mgnify:CR=1 FL=1
MGFRKDEKIPGDFSKITISLASPEMILERSHGEVTKPETITINTLDSLYSETLLSKSPI